jgi:hypothetical protein
MALTEIKGFIILARHTLRPTRRPHAVMIEAILTVLHKISLTESPFLGSEMTPQILELIALYPQPVRQYRTLSGKACC